MDFQSTEVAMSEVERLKTLSACMSKGAAKREKAVQKTVAQIESARKVAVLCKIRLREEDASALLAIAQLIALNEGAP